MATPVLIPVSEYLATTYRPDRDYDPALQTAHRASVEGSERILDVLTIDGTAVRIDVAALFAELADLLAWRL